jgi:Fe-S cluster biosynthesis and repair protein YggX
MAIVTCTRCSRTEEGLPFSPYPDEIGTTIQRSVCAACWREYMGRQTMVINEYRLDLTDPQAQEILTRDMLDFLKLGGPGGSGGEESEEG